MWQSLPDEVLLGVFSFMSDRASLNAGLTCRGWFKVSRDNLLWKKRLYAKYAPTQLLDASLEPFRDDSQSSFLSVYKSFEQEVPRVCIQTLTFHNDEVLHVSFSNNGRFVCSSSKDARAAIWTVTDQLQLERYDVINFSDYRVVGVPWLHVQYSEFNADDTMLLVSACGMLGDSNRGEVAVYDMQLKQVIGLYKNNPFDLAGTWLDDTTVVHGQLRFVGERMTDTVVSASDVVSNVQPDSKEIGCFRCINGAYLRQLRILTFKTAEYLESGDDHCRALLYTLGESYYSPHQLGCCVIPASASYSDSVKKASGKGFLAVEFNGHVIGLAVSTDQQYLYVNCRSFTDDHVEPGPSVGPPIVSDVAMRVYRLKSPMEWEHIQTLSGHRCFTEAENCFFIYLDVGKHYVAR